MAGIRIGGVTVIPVCSPPFALFEGSGGDSDSNVFRACNQAASQITDFNDAGTTCEQATQPVLSPDGTKILFEVLSPSSGYTEIWVVNNLQGSTATQLLADGSNYYMMPSWHPDSDQFLCVHGASGAFEGSVEATSVTDPGTIDVLVTQDGTNAPYRPQYNFDGSRVAYFWDLILGPGGELWVMDSDGTNNAQLDSAVDYRFQGAQGGWANTTDVFAYDDGGGGSSHVYLINGDGSGKTQLDVNGADPGSSAKCSDRPWPPDDSYVVYSAVTAFVTGFNPIRAELDGSDTTVLNNAHGGANNTYFRQVLVYDGRIWFIETGTTLASCALDGTGYRVDLVTDGVILDSFTVSDAWYEN